MLSGLHCRKDTANKLMQTAEKPGYSADHNAENPPLSSGYKLQVITAAEKSPLNSRKKLQVITAAQPTSLQKSYR